MAKATAKTSSSSPVKKTTAAKPKAKIASIDPLQKISEETLKKLQALGIEQQLQADLAWCIGSYSHDKNPIGLRQMLERSQIILKHEQAKKTKGITSKLIDDLAQLLKTN
jgi:hypothetical protein